MTTAPSPSSYIAIVDDDSAIRTALGRALRMETYEVGLFEDGGSALKSIQLRAPDAIVLDLQLPDVDGLEVCRRIRRAGDATPILMLTARDAVNDRVAGLDVGADDYLVKPFAFAELVARLRALARRGRNERPSVLVSGDLRLDPATHQVTVGAKPVPLAGREFALLEYLLRHQGEVLSRTRIIDEVWDWAFDGSPRIIDVYVRALRSHMGRGARTPRIETIRGVGYALRPKAGSTVAGSADG